MSGSRREIWDRAIEGLGSMLERAGFHNHSRRRELPLGGTLGSIIPTYFFDDPNGHYEGICVFLDDASEQNSNAVGELRRQFFEVIEITISDLSHSEAMRAHFFQLARALFGRDSAARVRDDVSWFTAITEDAGLTRTIQASRTVVSSPDLWEESISLLPTGWRPLAQTLRDSGIPGPTDVDWEVPVGGRVGERRALMMWKIGDGYLALVEGLPTSSSQIAVSPETDGSALAAMLKKRLLGPETQK